MVAKYFVYTNPIWHVNRYYYWFFSARNVPRGWRYLKYFVFNQLSKNKTIYTNLNVYTKWRSDILNHYTIVNIYCFKMYQKNRIYPNIPHHMGNQMRYVTQKKNRVPGIKSGFCKIRNRIFVIRLKFRVPCF